MRILWLSNRVASVRASISNKFTLPERFKGTVVEKWSKYWTGLLNDYGEVVAGVAKEIRTKPRKAAVIAGTTYALYACAQRNPDEERFMQVLRHWDNQLIMVPSELQNPVSADYLRTLEQAVNQNRVRMTSLGLFTIVWLDLYDKHDCTYVAICKHTGVGYWNFHERVIDIGLWNNFWNLQRKMRNYDVNYL